MQQPPWRLLALATGALFLQSCAPPPPDPAIPGHVVRRAAADRLTAVVVSNHQELEGSASGRLTLINMAGDTDGGSATPISPDGYFLTADHVLAQSGGRRVFVVYRNGGNVRHAAARIVWRSAGSDLAVVHAPLATPYFYRWTDPGKWVPAGTPVMHAGLATGSRARFGKLTTGLPPESVFSGDRKFKMDIPLRPGDSGGPVLDAHGRLIGVNSAVEYLVPMETAFFIDSECSRPNVRALDALLERDRRASVPERR